jgi:hypothetical protein
MSLFYPDLSQNDDNFSQSPLVQFPRILLYIMEPSGEHSKCQKTYCKIMVLRSQEEKVSAPKEP